MPVARGGRSSPGAAYGLICWQVASVTHYHAARMNAFAERSSYPACVIELTNKDVVKELENHRDQLFRRETISRDIHWQELAPAERRHRMHARLSELHPAVVCVNGWTAPGAVDALLWCQKRSVPAIVMSESNAHDEVRPVWKEAIKRRLVDFFSAGLAGGRASAAYLKNLGMRGEKIFQGYDVVDNDYFLRSSSVARSDAQSWRERKGLPQTYFLAASRFEAKKNLFRLIEAYGRYAKIAEHIPWKMIILGDGDLREDLERKLDEEGVRERVLLPGFAGYQDLPIYYGLAGAFVHASTTEQWGLVVNEAMASGLPVIVSNRCGCAPDLVRNGVNGYTFDPYDVGGLAGLMLKVASDECDRKAMGWASQEIIADWGPERFADGLMKAVEAALSRPVPKASWLDRTLLWALAHR